MAVRKLSTYRSKRDFTRTPEPSGRQVVAPSAQARFVIQKHAARRLHYDLRLELGGVFKSWAVTRGPSLDPGQKRLAVEVEDHPLDYGDFEGTIPRGEYGGGTVQLWDRGFWLPEGNLPPAEQLRKGELKFQLAGERLHGSWVLVRMKSDRFGGKRTNWLLIKHRDASALAPDEAEAILAEDRSVASGRKMADIAAGKGRAPQPFMLAGPAAEADAVWHSNRDEAPADTPAAAGAPRAADRTSVRATAVPTASSAATRSAGATAKAAGAASRSHRQPPPPSRSKAASLIPKFVPPQLGRLVDRPPSGPGWGHEMKLDGYRVQLRIVNGEATLKTRKGLDWTPKFSLIAQAAAGLPDALLDGEVTVLDERGHSTFSGLQAALSARREEQLVLFVFDLLFLGNEDVRSLPLSQRKALLKKLLSALSPAGRQRIRYVDHLEGEGEKVWKSACDMGLEGIISKRLDSPYTSTRSDTWTKAKCRGGQEVVIGAWTTTQSAFRSLLVGVHRGGRLAYVGRVGSGFAQPKVKAMLPKLKALESDTSPFSGEGAPRAEPNIHWVRPKLVAEIEFAGWTADGNVRQAAFKGLREDKPPAEIIVEEAEPVEEVEKAVQVQGNGPRARGKSSLARDKSPRTRGESSRGAIKAGRAGSRRSRVAAATVRTGVSRSGSPGRARGSGRTESTRPRHGKATTTGRAKPSPTSPGRAKAAKANTRSDSRVGSRAVSSSRTAGAPAAGTPRAGSPIIMGVTLSHPDKALWPDAGDGKPVDKLELAHYYETLGEWILPHLAGRPCSIVRAPDGIQGQIFFQRHAMPGTSDLLALVRVSGDRKPYLQIDRVEGLIAVAQVAALELHPWNCQPDTPDIPGRLVFDLDPAPDVAFAAVIEAALELRQRLEALGLVTFCKSTGGKGLHVVTPLAPESAGHEPDWPLAKTFAQTVCTQMANDSPNRYVVNMAKSVRNGRIFLDYLRNDRMATAVAPLSTRARPGARVSMPLNWSSVRSGLDPGAFTIRTASAQLARSKAWSDYAPGARSLQDAIRKLTRRQR